MSLTHNSHLHRATNRASVSVDGKRIVSIDSGAREHATCLSHTEDHEQQMWKYAMKEGKCKIGIDRSQMKGRPTWDRR